MPAFICRFLGAQFRKPLLRLKFHRPKCQHLYVNFKESNLSYHLVVLKYRLFVDV